MTANSPSEGWSTRLLEEQEARAKKSQGWQNKPEKPKEWVVDQPKVHVRSHLGSSTGFAKGQVKAGAGMGSRAMSHPASGEEKIPLKH